MHSPASYQTTLLNCNFLHSTPILNLPLDVYVGLRISVVSFAKSSVEYETNSVQIMSINEHERKEYLIVFIKITQGV